MDYPSTMVWWFWTDRWPGEPVTSHLEMQFSSTLPSSAENSVQTGFQTEQSTASRACGLRPATDTEAPSSCSVHTSESWNSHLTHPPYRSVTEVGEIIMGQRGERMENTIFDSDDPCSIHVTVSPWPRSVGLYLRCLSGCFKGVIHQVTWKEQMKLMILNDSIMNKYMYIYISPDIYIYISMYMLLFLFDHHWPRNIFCLIPLRCVWLVIYIYI